MENINFYINEYILIETSKHYLEKQKWEGDLIENNQDHIILKINNKGRFQKLKILKQDIVFIKTTAKLRKEK